MCKRADKLNQLFFKNAIEFNAETTSTHTCYYIEGLDKKVKEFADLFVQNMTVLELNTTKKEFEQELVKQLRAENNCLRTFIKNMTI